MENDIFKLNRNSEVKVMYIGNGIYKELLAEQEEVNKQIKAYNEILKQHNNYLMNFYNISRGL